MEQILAIIVFVALAAVCVFGLLRSQRASAERGRGDFGRGDSFAMVGSRNDAAGSASGSGASPGRRTEDRVTVSEVAEPKGLDRERTTNPDDARREPVGERRPQAERPLASGDAGT